MDLKKSHKANLERRQGGRFFLGLTMTTKLAEVNAAPEIDFDMDMVDNIRREEIKPLPKPKLLG